MSRRFVWHGLIAVVTAIGLTGCALIPTTGPVVQISPTTVPTNARPVDVEPAPPVQDGDPDEILAGFLTAVASGSPNRWAIARQYLTPRAAGEWDPTSGVTIYSSDGPQPIVTDQSAVLKTPVIGQIDADGHFTAVDDQDFTHNFAMVEDATGQWRIDDPGSGIFISQYRFQTSFRAVPVYFFTKTLDRLLVENLYVNWSDATPTTAVEGLLKGPSAWLSPAALTVIPAQTKLVASSVPVQNGVAQVSLTQPAAGLSDTQQVQLAAQLLSTLQAVQPAISGVRIDVAGVPMAVRGQGTDGVVRADTIAGYTTAPPPQSQSAFGLLDDGTVIKLPTDPGAAAQPVPGPLGMAGSDWGDEITSLAVSPDGSTLALASASSLWLASTTSGAPANKSFDAKGLVRPQADSGGVWAIAGGSVPTLRYVPYGGLVVSTTLDELAGATIIAFRVSPDRSRMAVLARIDGHDMLGLLRIGSTAPLSVDGWRPLVVNTGRGTLDNCLDVGWTSAMQLVVLASATKDASVVVYRLDVDAALVESLGPIGDDTPVSLAAQPRSDGQTLLVVTGTGNVLRYEDRTHWSSLVSGLKTIALPG